MITINNLQTVHTSNIVKDFLNHFNFIHSKNKKMIGVTLTDDLNYFILKYYLELNKDDLSLADNFKELKKVSNKIDFSIPTSFAIGLKLDNNLNSKDYLHLKFGKNLKLNPKSNKLKFLTPALLTYGVSIEKNKNIKEIKKYFYSKNEKEKIKQLFKLQVELNDVDHFEIYETKSNTKVNIIFDYFKDNCVLKFLTDNNLLKHNQNVQTINKFFNKTPKYAGIDKNGNLSVYYSFTNTA
jgi:hypothetical protein